MTLPAGDLVSASGLERFDLEVDGACITRMPWAMERVLGDHVHAMTIGSTIFVHSSRYDAVVGGAAPELLAHELIHVRQWRRYGKVPFLRRYLLDYLRLRLMGLDHPQAYRGIGFEFEAFKESKNMVEII